jgi:hypothetical protein
MLRLIIRHTLRSDQVCPYPAPRTLSVGGRGPFSGGLGIRRSPDRKKSIGEEVQPSPMTWMMWLTTVLPVEAMKKTFGLGCGWV